MSRLHALWIAPLAVAALAVPAANVYYKSGGGQPCARCHEIAPNYLAWSKSTHRGVKCENCHESGMIRNARRVLAHARGTVPEQVHMSAGDAIAMIDRCRSCHRQEFADWQSGPHGVTYHTIFFDPTKKRAPLMDDCLRCHGAHFDGGMRELTKVAARVGNLPAIPCLACHQMHRDGAPMVKNGPAEILRPSLAWMDRRERMHFAAQQLPLPAMMDGAEPVKMSPDVRQALCYQCHAAIATRQVKSGDDRTPIGVHEGLSCLACHAKHGQRATASCASCHPRLSNCGRDVEKMDTTFASKTSTHNIHFVKCIDCHPKGRPEKKREIPIASRIAMNP